MTKQEEKTYFYVKTKQEARRRNISIWQEEIDDGSLIQEGKENEYGTAIIKKHRSKNIDLKHTCCGWACGNCKLLQKINLSWWCGFGGSGGVNLEREKV
jgi:hypothetical protein